VYAYLDAMDSQ